MFFAFEAVTWAEIGEIHNLEWQSVIVFVILRLLWLRLRLLACVVHNCVSMLLIAVIAAEIRL